jgi:hypothetical protein
MEARRFAGVMMGDDNLPINVSFNRSKKITEHIPEDAARAKVHAWLDVISPITEWAGLKGDALRRKRELMRLEQEASLVALGQKLKEKLEGKTITPLAPKVLIPSLEKASLEPPDSEMIAKWANLLAAEALDPSDDARTCVSIFGELGHYEAEIMDSIQKRLVASDLWDQEKFNQRYSAIRQFMKDNYDGLRTIVERHGAGELSDEDLNPLLGPILEKSPAWVFSLRMRKSKDDQQSLSLPFSEDQRVAVDILEYRNLIVRREYMELLRGVSLLTIDWFDLTNLGFRFLKKVSDV